MVRRAQRRPDPSLADGFEGLRADFSAAKYSRFRRQRTGILSIGSGADWHYRVQSEFLRIMEYARDMDRNDCIVGQTVDRAVVNEVRGGLKPDPKTGDDGVNAELKDRFREWSEDADECDVTGENNFHAMEKLVSRAGKVDGDIFALPLREGCLQMIEGHRSRTPVSTTRNVVHGVLLDGRRKPQEYWFTKDDVDPMQAVRLVSDMERYPARDADGNRNVFHVYNPKRFTQTRGVSAFAPIFDLLGMFEDVNFAKLVQQQIVSCFAVFHQRDLNFQSDDGAQAGEQTSENLPADGSTRLLQGIAPGMEVFGKPGEKLEGFSPNVPNAEFFPHMKLILTLIGINLGMPLILVLLDASETNFSAWRGVVDQARQGFDDNQRTLRERFHGRVYRWKVSQWIAEDPALHAASKALGKKIYAHVWSKPGWPYIDPLKDAQADLLRQRNALISPRRLQAERGREWTELAQEIVEDNAFAIAEAKRAAKKINSQFPDDDPVHWRELISLPTPEGTKVSIAADSGAGYGSSADDEGAPPKPTKRKEAALV
jgi:lambda family phage portal protein